MTLWGGLLGHKRGSSVFKSTSRLRVSSFAGQGFAADCYFMSQTDLEVSQN